MFEEQRRREVTVTGQQQPATASGGSASFSADGGLRAMLSGDTQEGTSRQTGGAAFLTRFKGGFVSGCTIMS